MTTPPGAGAAPKLYQSFGCCEECYVAEEFGETPPHVDGHCWTAADLLACPELRQPPPGPPAEVLARGEAHDITPRWDNYTGPDVYLSWQNNIGVARSNDPRCPVPWVLVPATLLSRLAAEAHASGNRALAEEVRALVREAPMADGTEATS